MKQIILSLTIGLLAGYGVTSAFENAEISQLQNENRNSKQQVAKLTEQLLILQKQTRSSPRIAQRQVSKQPAKNLASKSLHKTKRTKQSQEQTYAQRKQVIRAQQTHQNKTALKKQQVKTTENGIVL